MPMRHAIDPAMLGGVALFQGLPPENLKAVIERADWRRLHKGDAVFRQSDPADTMFVLVTGHVKVHQATADGQQVVIRFINPWEMMGCVAVCGGGSYPGTAEAVEDCGVLAWPRGTLDQLMDRFPRIARNALSTVSHRLQDTQQQLREVATERVERRIAHALMRLAELSGRRGADGGTEIAFPITRKDIADMTGTTLHTVSRTLSGWEAQGLVANARQRITVLQPDALGAIADDWPTAS